MKYQSLRTEKCWLLLLNKLLLMLTFLLSYANSFAQETQMPNRSLPPIRKEYSVLEQISPAPREKFASLDSISFPIEKMNKGFYRALKLRAVYIDVPVEHFKLPDFPANSSLQTRAKMSTSIKAYLIIIASIFLYVDSDIS